ncbi:MAG TPA: Gfo/Idh/MocA family oxidoreductase [Hyphomicrobiaceae bacterium]|nr:Gfo/Idh/MocA family oxidoreductase [Hyphomicrobiaceae bacterium]
MRVLIVGYGVQGRKRMQVAGRDVVGIVDPYTEDASWRRLSAVPLERYDAAIVCTPDDVKLDLLRHLAEHGKHALVEKPLLAGNETELLELEEAARRTGAFLYTAYNHRFEPHFLRMRELVRSGVLGRLYCCRMFYGNGTARLVRQSDWRDRGGGVLPDLGSHLLDTVRWWFGNVAEDWRIVSASAFETRAPDHVVVASSASRPKLELEMTLLSWRNHFTCDLFAEHGSAHIRSLCKWGPTTFTHRVRVLPSGRPLEESSTLVRDDPTWAAEYAHFSRLAEEGTPTDLANDRWLSRELRRLSAEARP